MRTIIIIIVSLAFIGSCKPEEETYLKTRYINNTTVPISFHNHYGDQTNIVNIFPGEENSSTNNHRGASNSFPIRLFYFSGDSFIVYFADTLRMVHLSQWLSNDSMVYQGRNEVILYNYSRNLYNLESYEKIRLKENFYEAKYVFTEEDLQYAVSVYE